MFNIDGVVHLGSIKLNKSRLLRVQLANLNQKRKLLQMLEDYGLHLPACFRKFILHQIWLSVQQTPTQKQLRAELKRRKENGG